ncbi:MAG: hypothetical protein HYY35_07785 [Deltaproteobacteria bacterium]|nr:hypothetical protein [Deltaproteobacteria bacterium]
MAALLVLLALLCSCLPSSGPQRPEPSRRQQRLLKATSPEVWRATHAVIDEQRLTIADEDEREGRIHLTRRRTSRVRPEEIERELRRIAELDKARRMGLQRLSEYLVEYAIEVARLGDDETRFDVSTRITAVDRSEAFIAGPGLVQVIPRSFDVPSNGVLERELVDSIGSRLYLGEEMLYCLGVLGRE